MKNYYIDRNEENKIINIYLRPQYDGQEVLLGSDQEMISFFTDAETEKENNLVKTELYKIDILSIRSIREFLVLNFPNEPLIEDYLVTQEEQAKLKRDKLK